MLVVYWQEWGCRSRKTVDPDSFQGQDRECDTLELPNSCPGKNGAEVSQTNISANVATWLFDAKGYSELKMPIQVGAGTGKGKWEIQEGDQDLDLWRFLLERPFLGI